ncbi:tigger transposable element-derived protein 4-like [Octopus sinensis]|uniref:Tigger transposable element-derived protein 4-like n=1 Tax=Octopus sinensis TaxID=2607531 RepID=A0A6P7TQU2_9MOLL|nr:tigger transposable element-derived protein 4-like [Octopus sinensis]
MFHNLRSDISRKQYLKFTEIDDNTIAWVNSMDLKGAILNDRIVTEKAKAFALNLEITEFKGSKGWLVKFKKRNGLKLRNMHGESATPNLVSDFIELIKNKISLYGAQNVYNADETGLFYKMIPSKSVCKTIKSGYKVLKDRVSVMLCTNVDGTDKRTPLLIGLFKNPRFFKNFDIKKYVIYSNSKRAWMDSRIFNQFLLKWEMELRKQDRKIFLVVDQSLKTN